MKTITLCGSTKFKHEFERVNRELTLLGNVVIGADVFSHDSDIILSDSQKQLLDEINLRKIDLADEVFILDVGGYTCETTDHVIHYAQEQGKSIVYFSAHPLFTGEKVLVHFEDSEEVLVHHTRKTRLQ